MSLRWFSAMSNFWSVYSRHLGAPGCLHNHRYCVHKMKSNVSLSKILQIGSYGSKYAINTGYFCNRVWDYHFNIAVKFVLHRKNLYQLIKLQEITSYSGSDERRNAVTLPWKIHASLTNTSKFVLCSFIKYAVTGTVAVFLAFITLCWTIQWWEWLPIRKLEANYENLIGFGLVYVRLYSLFISVHLSE
jgi:hypothetical protein